MVPSGNLAELDGDAVVLRAAAWIGTARATGDRRTMPGSSRETVASGTFISTSSAE
jgi:hypothetical protein